MRPPLALLALALCALGAGCGHRIGDTCNTNVDCSPLGDRFCDVASPSGYCTIEGCDVRVDQSGNLIDSCTQAAGESFCVRFFTLQACKPCDPQRATEDCASDEVCLCDDINHCAASSMDQAPDGGLQCGAPGFVPDPTKLGHCARLGSERRWCMLRCNNDGDCRGVDKGYHCAQVGSNGAEPVPRGFVPVDAAVASPDAGTLPDGGPDADYTPTVASPMPTADYTQKFCVYRAQ